MVEECDPYKLEDDWFYDSITRYVYLVHISVFISLICVFQRTI